VNWINVFIAMLPEELLLGGIVLLAAQEIAGLPRAQGGFRVSLLSVTLATAAAAWLAANGFEFAAFPGQYSVNAAALTAKAIVLALAVPVLLISRDDPRNASFIS
jgi:NADH:ubiquinone oxidoreductase subunit 2 (subunit N)